MKKLNICLSKECLTRAFRTFLQTAIGYIITNISLYVGGIDFADGDMLKNALIGLAVASLSAGASAVMNIEKGDKIQDE